MNKTDKLKVKLLTEKLEKLSKKKVVFKEDYIDQKDPYYWTTEECHSDNNFTMQDYLNNHLSDEFEVTLEDGTYAEITSKSTGAVWGVHASGNGDCFNHKVEFKNINLGRFM